MRTSLAVILALSLSASAAWAQNASPAAATPAASPASPATAPDPNKLTPVPTAKFSEPNMKMPKNSGGKTASPLITEAPIPGDFAQGSDKAPLTMVEYASMSCPHCAHFSGSVLPELQKTYIETGKMRYILRQFPLNDPALKAAMLLDCVGEQNKDKYYQFAKVLFDAQSKWAFDANYMQGLETIAGVGGVSKDQFASCTSNTDREMKLLKQKKQTADELKVPHTPYIFIGNEAYEGERDVKSVSEFIEKKLAEVKK